MSAERQGRAEAVLHRAPFVLPVERPLIADGAVLVSRGVIRAVGRYRDLAAERPATVVLREHEEAVIVPALINAHAHLELSYLAEVGQQLSGQPVLMTEWIEELLGRRGAEDEETAARRAGRAALAALYATGCLLVADIGNRPSSRTIGDGLAGIRVVFLLEMLGISRAGEQQALAQLNGLDGGIGCTAHAPYSTGARLFRALKERARRRGQVFSVHVAESAAELEFLRSGSGPFRDFLVRRGLWDGSFVPPGVSSVKYLDSLGVLDERTLCVHAVHVDDEDADILACRGAPVCLCPGSNDRLGTGTAPVDKFLARGMLPALGTDSLASNGSLNLWTEMQRLAATFPALDPHTIFAMTTMGGARALGVSETCGTLAAGKSAAMLTVRTGKTGAADICSLLVTDGEGQRVSWLH